MSARVLETPLRVLGTGSALPGPRVDNVELLDAVERHLGRRPRRRARAMLRRLGIEGRHLARDLEAPVERARPGDTNPDLAAAAMKAALAAAARDANDLGFLLGHTTSPATQLPPNVSWVADAMHYDGPFLELRQACTGFAAALQAAAGMLQGPEARPIGIVGSETGSLHFEFDPAFVDEHQLVNCAQMGDGAGAVVLAPDGTPGLGTIEALWYGSRGQGKAPGFWMDGGPQVNGRRTAAFEHDHAAVREHGPALFDAGVEAAAALGYALDQVDFVLPHQANGRMPEHMARAFGIPRERVLGDGADIGNLGSAAIWTSFDRLVRSGRMRAGQTLLVLGAEATKYLYGGFVYRHAA